MSKNITLTIRNCRDRKHWSQAQAAAQLGVSQSTFNSWESGNKIPTFEQMLKMYFDGERNLVFSTKSTIAVKDTLFDTRDNFIADSLRTIPFSGGQPIEMNAVEKMVSGVKVPLFEANMPYDVLLKGLDRQLIVNLKADCKDKNRFEGLQVGSIDMPNNNAGNWE